MSLTSVRTAARPRAGSESLIESLLAESFAALAWTNRPESALRAAVTGSILESASIAEAVGETMDHDAIAHDRASQCRLTAGATAFAPAAIIAQGARRLFAVPLTLQLVSSLLDVLLHALALLIAAEAIGLGPRLHRLGAWLGDRGCNCIARTVHWRSRHGVARQWILLGRWRQWRGLKRPSLTPRRLLIRLRDPALLRRGLGDVDSCCGWRGRGQLQH